MSKTTALLAAAVCTLSSAAWADSVEFPGWAHGYETVNYSTPGASGYDYAGGFATSLNGGPSFTSYCVDLLQPLNFTDHFDDYVSVGSGHEFANAAAYNDLGRLFASFHALVDTSVAEAAFQIAVWEIAYETSGSYVLSGPSGGSATFTGGSAETSGALTLAQSWLDNLGGNMLSPQVYDSATHQDIVFAPVPEPSTVMLMVAGMLGLGTMAKRRRTWNADRA